VQEQNMPAAAITPNIFFMKNVLQTTCREEKLRAASLELRDF
jgi:hypothetical protein